MLEVIERDSTKNLAVLRKNEDLKRRGGGRLKHYNFDGDVPLRLRKTEGKSKDGSSSNKKNNDDKKQNDERKQRFVRRFDKKEK